MIIREIKLHILSAVIEIQHVEVEKHYEHDEVIDFPMIKVLKLHED